ncbi:MAG: TOBE domain-containing protein, partial [Oscillospiraceae bacterium]|nr:TOBE domain-containing protein [Oscillospiraceae bacterium]
NTTFIYVTHDQTEAMTLGDRIVIMSDGFIQQIGTPQEVFNHPANLFVAGFIGSPQMNFFNANLVKEDGKYAVVLDGYKVVLPEDKQEALKAADAPEQEITLGIRPEHIVLADDGVNAKIDVSEMMGSTIHLHVTAVDQDVIIIVNTMDMSAAEIDALCSGTDVKFSFSGNNCHLFNKETGKNLI